MHLIWVVPWGLLGPTDRVRSGSEDPFVSDKPPAGTLRVCLYLYSGTDRSLMEVLLLDNNKKTINEP